MAEAGPIDVLVIINRQSTDPVKRFLARAELVPIVPFQSLPQVTVCGLGTTPRRAIAAALAGLPKARLKAHQQAKQEQQRAGQLDPTTQNLGGYLVDLAYDCPVKAWGNLKWPMTLTEGGL